MKSVIFASLALALLSVGACTIQPAAPAATPVVVTAPAQPTSTIVVPRSY